MDDQLIEQVPDHVKDSGEDKEPKKRIAFQHRWCGAGLVGCALGGATKVERFLAAEERTGTDEEADTTIDGDARRGPARWGPAHGGTSLGKKVCTGRADERNGDQQQAE